MNTIFRGVSLVPQSEEAPILMKTRLIREFQDLYAYDRWANARTLDAASALPPDALTQRVTSSFTSVLDTLAHILSAKWVWLSRWRGHSPTSWPAAWDVSTLPLLRERYQEVEDTLQKVLDDDSVDGTSQFR